MTRFCGTCRQPRPLREFDLSDGHVRSTCRGCCLEGGPSKGKASRAQRGEQLVVLERQRRSLIAALVKIDAEIAELRGRPVKPPGGARAEPIDGDGDGDVDVDLGFGD